MKKWFSRGKARWMKLKGIELPKEAEGKPDLLMYHQDAKKDSGFGKDVVDILGGSFKWK